MPPLPAANGPRWPSLPVEQRALRLKTTLRLGEVIGEFVSASNLTLLAVDGDGQRWVYKAMEAMTQLWDFDAQTLPARELAAYEVSEALGFGLVPETVWTEGPLGPGSAQRFIEVDTGFDPRSLFVPEPNDELWPVAVFDIVCNNADRKLGHLLKEKGTGRLFAIDNGLTFHSEPKLRTVLWGLSGRQIPQSIKTALEGLRSELVSDLGSRIAALLSAAEIGALKQRLSELLRTNTHPPPPEDRPPVPWPVW